MSQQKVIPAKLCVTAWLTAEEFGNILLGVMYTLVPTQFLGIPAGVGTSRVIAFVTPPFDGIVNIEMMSKVLLASWSAIQPLQPSVP